MDEELRHIDLIDKYLNQNLDAEEQKLFEQLLQNDPEFARELEIYRKLYRGIEQQGHQKLKTRLDQYYENYKKQQVAPTASPKRRQRSMWMRGMAVAASLALVALVVYYNQYWPDPGNGQITEDTLGMPNDDSTQLKQQPPEEPLTQGQSQQSQDPTLSVGGITYLSPASVRKMEYPSPLQYTFTDDTLTILGDPLLPALSLQVLKALDNRYFLKLKDQYFSLDVTTVPKLLEAVSFDFTSSRTDARDIKVKIEGIQNLSQPTVELSVSFTSQQSLAATYYFDSQDSPRHLTIDGKVDPQMTKAYLIQEGNDIIFFLMIGEKLYALDPQNTSPAPLQEVNILSNNRTRLFRQRDPIIKPLELVD